MNTNLLMYAMVLVSIISILFFRKQMLASLIMMEMTALSLFLMLIMQFNQFHQPVSICFYMLILSACEASMALALFVMMTRMKGNDLLSTISTQKY